MSTRMLQASDATSCCRLIGGSTGTTQNCQGVVHAEQRGLLKVYEMRLERKEPLLSRFSSILTVTTLKVVRF